MGAIVSCWLALHPLIPAILVSVFLFLHAMYEDHRLSQPSVTALEVNEHSCRIHWQGHWTDVEVQEALVTQLLTVIHFNCAGRFLPLVLLDHQLDADNYRRLRTWLRWRKIEKDSSQHHDPKSNH